MGTERRRKVSVFDTQPPSISVPLRSDEVKFQYRTRRRKCLQSRKNSNSRDKDFFVPDDADEWVLPEYRSLFHHLFLKDEFDSSSGAGSSTGGDTSIHNHQVSQSPASQRRRKISPSGSTGSSTTSEEDGPLCNLVKSFPSWLKKVFHISENQEDQQSQDEADARHAWLDEIPIEICDRLRHIHIYV